MNNSQSIESILLADCGSLTTRVTLIELIEGEYRFVGRGEAPSTLAPSSDITIGVQQAISQLEQLTGRRFISAGSLEVPRRENGDGVDVFIALTSAGDILPLLVAADAEGKAMQSTKLVAQSLCTFNIQEVTLAELQEGSPGMAGGPTGRPPVIAVVDGQEGSDPKPLVKLAELLVSRSRFLADSDDGEGKTRVIFAGNGQAVDQLAGIFQGKAEFRAIENIRPTDRVENPAPLRQALRDVYAQEALPKIPGIAKLAGWSNAEISPSTECVGLVTRFIAKQYRRAVLTADVGGSALGLFMAKDDAFTSVIDGKLGLGRNIANVVANLESDDVARWLPFEVSPDEIVEWARNAKANPSQAPSSSRDLLIEQAFARAALRHLISGLGPAPEHLPLDLIIAAGRILAGTPRPGQAALLLLDALQPRGELIGSVELAVDSTLLMPVVGGLAPIYPDAAVSVFDRDALLWLGTCIVPLGSAREGAPAVSLTIEHPEKGQLQVDVPFGSIKVVPLAIGQRAALTVQPAKEFRIGSSEKGKQVKTALDQEVKGGLIGLIVDARGRPIALPDDQAQRQAKVRDWMTSLDALPGGV